MREQNDGDLFDRLYLHFGMGDYDESSPKAPEWHKWRAGQVRQIKALRLKRRVDVFELMETIDYCLEHGLYPRHHSWLYEHITTATRWSSAQRVEAASRELDEKVRAALEVESSRGDSPWTARLLRAAGPYRQEVYEAWLKERS